MTKIKKIIASAMATMALATCVTGISISATTSTPDSTKNVDSISVENKAAKATFTMGPGASATMQNNATYSRYCTALVTIRKNIDNGFVTSSGNEGACGQDGSVSATVYGYTGSDYKVNYSGNIRSGNVVQSPSDWTPSY